MSYKVNGRIWIESDKGPFLGLGRVDLLVKIREYGSISKAAASMNMAYRQAWHLVQSMNQKAPRPLVSKLAGGRGGGGARITEEGEKAITEFEDLNRAFAEFMQLKSGELQL